MSDTNKTAIELDGDIKLPLLKHKRNYCFDSKRDIKRVEPASVLQLSEILASGVVPPSASEMDFNQIEDPDNVAGRVTNVFDAIDEARRLTSSAKAVAPKPAPNAGGSSTSSEPQGSASTGTAGGE